MSCSWTAFETQQRLFYMSGIMTNQRKPNLGTIEMSDFEEHKKQVIIKPAPNDDKDYFIMIT